MSAPAERAARKVAVISGGAGGLGTALSQALQQDGWQVVLVDVDVRDLPRTELQHPISCDLTDASALTECCANIMQSHNKIDLVIYAAGVTAIAPVAELDARAHRHLFEVNYFAATAMAQALLPAVRAARGTHLAITSVAGFAPLATRAAYAASKHAMTGFFASLRAEEAAHGVKTIIAAPSFVATNPGKDAPDANGVSRPGAAGDAVDVMSPQEAAAVILNGLRKGRQTIPVGRVARLSALLMRLSPRFYTYLMARTIDGPTAR